MGHSSKAPPGYQPMYQGQADQSAWDSMTSLNTAGLDLAKTAIPEYGAITQQVQNNPYYSIAQTGADNASMLGTNFVAPAQFGMASSAMDKGNSLGGYGELSAHRGVSDYDAAIAKLSQIWGGYNSGDASAAALTGAIPAATAGFGLAPGAYSGAMDMARNTSQGWQYAQPLLQDSLSMAHTLGGQIYDTAFDPQQSLYDRTAHQTLEHQNAINAQQGVSGSPFAAGVTGDAMRNFDIDWQNQQLQRQISGAGALDNIYSSMITGGVGNYDGLMGTAASNYGQLSNDAASQFSGLVDSATANLRGLTGDAFGDVQTAHNNTINGYATMLGAGTNAKSAGLADLANLTNTQLNSYGLASDLGNAGLNTMTTSAMYPNEVYINNLQQILSALNAQVGGTTAALGPMQQSIDDYLNYMKVGQSATANAQNAAQINNAASSGFLGGLGGLAGLAMAPFSSTSILGKLVH